MRRGGRCCSGGSRARVCVCVCMDGCRVYAFHVCTTCLTTTRLPPLSQQHKLTTTANTPNSRAATTGQLIHHLCSQMGAASSSSTPGGGLPPARLWRVRAGEERAPPREEDLLPVRKGVHACDCVIIGGVSM